MQHAQPLPRGPQEHAQDARHRAVGDALRHLRLVVAGEGAVEQRHAARVAAVRELLGEVEPARRLAAADRQRPQTQLRLQTLALGQHDRAALRLQHADRVVEDRVEQLVLALEVHEVVPGAQQCEELLAGPRHLVAVERDPPDALLERGRRGGDDVLVRGRPLGRRVVHLDDQRDLAELDDVARAQRLLARPDPHAVDVSPVGAFEVADAPAVVGVADLRVPAAD